MGDNLKESMRWFRHAGKYLKASKNSLKSGNYEWACFQAQQAAEKDLKPILYGRGFRKILTPSVFELITQLLKPKKQPQPFDYPPDPEIPKTKSNPKPLSDDPLKHTQFRIYSTL